MEDFQSMHFRTLLSFHLEFMDPENMELSKKSKLGNMWLPLKSLWEKVCCGEKKSFSTEF